jgi:hypothetical protein
MKLPRARIAQRGSCRYRQTTDISALFIDEQKMFLVKVFDLLVVCAGVFPHRRSSCGPWADIQFGKPETRQKIKRCQAAVQKNGPSGWIVDSSLDWSY